MIYPSFPPGLGEDATGTMGSGPSVTESDFTGVAVVAVSDFPGTGLLQENRTRACVSSKE